MDGMPRQVKVVEAHVTSHPSALRLSAGDALRVGRPDLQWPECVCGIDAAGHAGRVPAAYVQMTGEREATALRDYDATELTVALGETLEVVEEAGGWLLCRAPSGGVGWVPTRNVAHV